MYKLTQNPNTCVRIDPKEALPMKIYYDQDGDLCLKDKVGTWFFLCAVGTKFLPMGAPEGPLTKVKIDEIVWSETYET